MSSQVPIPLGVESLIDKVRKAIVKGELDKDHVIVFITSRGFSTIRGISIIRREELCNVFENIIKRSSLGIEYAYYAHISQIPQMVEHILKYELYPQRNIFFIFHDIIEVYGIRRRYGIYFWRYGATIELGKEYASVTYYDRYKLRLVKLVPLLDQYLVMTIEEAREKAKLLEEFREKNRKKKKVPIELIEKNIVSTVKIKESKLHTCPTEKVEGETPGIEEQEVTTNATEKEHTCNVVIEKRKENVPYIEECKRNIFYTEKQSEDISKIEKSKKHAPDIEEKPLQTYLTEKQSAPTHSIEEQVPTIYKTEKQCRDMVHINKHNVGTYSIEKPLGEMSHINTGILDILRIEPPQLVEIELDGKKKILLSTEIEKYFNSLIEKIATRYNISIEQAKTYFEYTILPRIRIRTIPPEEVIKTIRE